MMNQNLYNRDVSEEFLYREARRRVKEKASFYKHLYVFLTVNGVFLFLSLLRGRPFLSFPVIFFWGLGLFFHYLKVFGVPGSGILSKDWEDQEIFREMRKLKKARQEKEQNSSPEALNWKELRRNYDEADLV